MFGKKEGCAKYLERKKDQYVFQYFIMGSKELANEKWLYIAYLDNIDKVLYNFANDKFRE